MGMELTLAVVVCELVDGGNAVKAGVHLGDEINEVSLFVVCIYSLFVLYN